MTDGGAVRGGSDGGVAVYHAGWAAGDVVAGGGGGGPGGVAGAVHPGGDAAQALERGGGGSAAGGCAMAGGHVALDVPGGAPLGVGDVGAGGGGAGVSRVLREHGGAVPADGDRIRHERPHAGRGGGGGPELAVEG